MAELSVSGSSTQGKSGIQDEDHDFEPTADMLVHDFDDEATLEEEEILQGETNFSTEIDDLNREGEMPIHELLKMYGYSAEDSAEEEAQENSQEGAKENKEVGLTGSSDQEDDERSFSDESTKGSRAHSTAQLICSEPGIYFDANNADESEDEDYIPCEEWKKEVNVGPMYQAETPAGLCEYKDNERAYENEDQLLWKPESLPENEVVEFLAEALKRNQERSEVNAVPEKSLVKDNEHALYELVQCNFDKEEALKRFKSHMTPEKEELPVWAEEARRELETGKESNGDDVCSVQEANKQFKLWRRRPSLNSGLTDSEQPLGEMQLCDSSRTGTKAVKRSCDEKEDEDDPEAAGKRLKVEVELVMQESSTHSKDEAV